MEPRPRARDEDEHGVVRIVLPIRNILPEYPEVIAWDERYKAECDRLSEEAARLKKGIRQWGRWYFEYIESC